MVRRWGSSTSSPKVAARWDLASSSWASGPNGTWRQRLGLAPVNHHAVGS